MRNLARQKIENSNQSKILWNAPKNWNSFYGENLKLALSGVLFRVSFLLCVSSFLAEPNFDIYVNFLRPAAFKTFHCFSPHPKFLWISLNPLYIHYIKTHAFPPRLAGLILLPFCHPPVSNLPNLESMSSLNQICQMHPSSHVRQGSFIYKIMRNRKWAFFVC